MAAWEIPRRERLFLPLFCRSPVETEPPRLSVCVCVRAARSLRAVTPRGCEGTGRAAAPRAALLRARRGGGVGGNSGAPPRSPAAAVSLPPIGGRRGVPPPEIYQWELTTVLWVGAEPGAEPECGREGERRPGGRCRRARRGSERRGSDCLGSVRLGAARPRGSAPRALRWGPGALREEQQRRVGKCACTRGRVCAGMARPGARRCFFFCTARLCGRFGACVVRGLRALRVCTVCVRDA